VTKLSLVSPVFTRKWFMYFTLISIFFMVRPRWVITCSNWTEIVHCWSEPSFCWLTADCFVLPHILCYNLWSQICLFFPKLFPIYVYSCGNLSLYKLCFSHLMWLCICGKSTLYKSLFPHLNGLHCVTSHIACDGPFIFCSFSLQKPRLCVLS